MFICKWKSGRLRINIVHCQTKNTYEKPKVDSTATL